MTFKAAINLNFIMWKGWTVKIAFMTFHTSIAIDSSFYNCTTCSQQHARDNQICGWPTRSQANYCKTSIGKNSYIILLCTQIIAYKTHVLHLC